MFSIQVHVKELIARENFLSRIAKSSEAIEQLPDMITHVSISKVSYRPAFG
jgi:hypothetical protein